MLIITILSWAGVITVLSSYLLGTPKQFDWANALLFIPISLPAILVGAYPNAFISITFGVLAIIKLWRTR
jgi:uncharacterized membrane protein YfcA